MHIIVLFSVAAPLSDKDDIRIIITVLKNKECTMYKDNLKVRHGDFMLI